MSQDPRPLQDRLDQARRLISRCYFDDAFRFGFELGRRFASLGGEGEDYKPLLVEIAEEFGLDLDELWESYWEGFYRAAKKHGPQMSCLERLRWALEESRKEPIFPPVRVPGPIYGLIYSMSWYLAYEAHPLDFMLPRNQLGELLGLSPGTVSRFIRWLDREGLIVCVDERYSEGRCKKYRMGDGVGKGKDSGGGSRGGGDSEDGGKSQRRENKDTFQGLGEEYGRHVGRNKVRADRVRKRFRGKGRGVEAGRGEPPADPAPRIEGEVPF